MNQYHKTYLVRDHFFSKINTQYKAYIVGMLLADGYLNEKRNNISLSLSGESDAGLVQKIADRLFIKKYIIHNDNESKRNIRHQDRFKFWLSSKTISNDLKKMGFTGNKSHSCKFDFSVIPPHLFSHFLRGFFDGDGSVFLTKYNSLNVHFVGLYNIIEYIQKYLKEKYDIKSGIYPCFSTKAVYELRFGNIHNIHIFYKFLYKNAGLFLQRKKEKFRSGFKSLKSELNRKYTSQFVGVSFDKPRNKWKSYIWNKNKGINIGRYKTEQEAAESYNKFVIENKLNKELNRL